MKKIYLLLFASFLLSNINAQNKESYSKHFISFRMGYSVPVASSQIGSPRSEVGKTYIDEIIDNSGKTVKYSEKNSFGSRGAGINFSLGYGYMITQNFSFEVDFNYLYTLSFNDAFIERKKVTNKIEYLAKQKSQTSMFRITPMFGVYANEKLLIRPYAKFGLIVPFAGGTSVDLSIEDNSGVTFHDLMPVIDNDTYEATKFLLELLSSSDASIPTKTDIKAVTSGSFSLGFMGRLGAEYKLKGILNNKIIFFAEMEMQMLTVKANQTIIKEFYSTVNNEEVKKIAEKAGIETEFTVDDIPEILKTTDYLNEIIETSNSTYNLYVRDENGDIVLDENRNKISNPNYNRDKAFEQLTFRDNYNAFAFMIGIKYSF